MTMIHAADGITTYRGRFQSPEGITISPNDYYGVEWSVDPNAVTPSCRRIGSVEMHQTLPIQSGMYGCLLNDDGTENYKLDAMDWAFKEDGVTASVLDGTDGQVMVYVPGFYFASEVDGDLRRWKISASPIFGYDYQPAQYISAYEAALDRVNDKLASVVNLTAGYRGGTNEDTWDDTHRNLLGRPVTNIDRPAFRTAARARGTGWEMYTYYAHRALVILFTIEYATRHSQEAYTSQLDWMGFRLGGLGPACTNLAANTWNSWNAYNPFLPCGQTNNLGNGTGESAPYAVYATGTLDTNGIRYRGVENPFGHLHKNCDGINFENASATPYVSRDPDTFNDDDYEGMDPIAPATIVTGQYINRLIPGHILPILSGSTNAGSNAFWCDQYFRSAGAVLRTVLFGGAANAGAGAGLVCAYSSNAPSNTTASIGSRLCYFPAS